MTENSKTLELVLKKEWYEMIKSGEKKEEYREIKDYWNKRLTTNYEECIFGRSQQFLHAFLKYKDYVFVRFRSGYKGEASTYRIENIRVGRGKSEWGAPEEEVYIIGIGEKVD